MSRQDIEKHINPSDAMVGKRFPLWVVSYFRDLAMGEEPPLKPGEDPCREHRRKTKALRPYQHFISKYLVNTLPFQGLLVYHGLGSGKTAAVVHLIGLLNSQDNAYNVFVLLPAALQGSWIREFKAWLPNANEIMKQITFISTNASNLESQFFAAVQKADSTKDTLFVIDEAHNFIHNVRTNLEGNRRRASSVYDYIRQEVSTYPSTRVVLLSGTPIRSHPFEIALALNLIRPGSLPSDESTFNSMFLSDDEIPRLKVSRKHLFQKRIVGLVSFFHGSSRSLYATQKVEFLSLPMSSHQQEAYDILDAVEKKRDAMARVGGRQRSFRTFTRLASNFVFPSGTGPRPRASEYRLSGKDEKALLTGDKVKEDAHSSVKQYLRACTEALAAVDAHFKSSGVASLKTDIEAWNHEKKRNPAMFIGSAERSPTFRLLCTSSVKMTMAALLTASSPGQVLLYSNFVLMEGLQIMKMYLSYFGVDAVVDYHGSVNKEKREDNLRTFNEGRARVILLSAAGAEGISLRNVRRVIILEPAWTEDTIQQVIGRAIRQCSHRDLPMEDRRVEVYRLKAVIRGGSVPSTDEYIEDHALGFHTLKQSFLEALREAAVDCDLFKEQNQVGVCFRFPVKDQIMKTTGPAFTKDIDQDLKETDAVLPRAKRLRVRKIQGVYRNAQKKESFLLDEETGVVFSTDFLLPIGSVKRDEKGFFEKADVDVYIVEKLI